MNQSPNPIYTIGYGTRGLEDVLSVLLAHDIAYLIDVRSQPYSRHKPEFSKADLEHTINEAGMRYVFMGDLLGGRPSDPTCYTDGEIDYGKVAQRPFYQQGITRLQNAQQQNLRVALMCAEEKPENCHRTHLIAPSLLDLGIAIAHIDENDALIDQATAVARLTTPSISPQREEKQAPGAGGGDEPPPPEFDDYIPDDYPIYDDYVNYDDPPSYTPSLLPQLDIPDGATPAELLQQIFGYDEFRPLQEDVIDNVLSKQDTLTIMPTGSGKSLCYQLPALLFDGLTVVVSPLISLMQDQVDQLHELGVTAVTLNSTLPQTLYQDHIQQIRAGAVKLLYVAPETLMRPDILQLLQDVTVDCLTIDEAHCISEWGHDFRPDYRQLVSVRHRLPTAVCIAVTATATDRVRQDIKQSLAIPDAGEFIASFNRENLFLSVQAKVDGRSQLHSFLADHPDQSGIIYCATRKQVDELTADLTAQGWQALAYHAGLDDRTRQHNQREFVRDNVPIMVATIAFGMGINKSNVRFVVHYDLPKNLESYYQQIGRAGRDGLRADCLLLFSYGDVQTINYFIMQEAENQQIGSRSRLEAMISFAETAVCRRTPLLGYFGETYSTDDCQMCDNCTTSDDELVDITVSAQKFLSCVKRTGELYGTNHIIDVLRGSQSQKILSKGHDRLSTYNIGTEFSKKEWQFLARQFIQNGLLTQDMEYGSLKLTAQAYAVFKGEKVEGRLPEKTTTAVAPSQFPYDPDLFARLRQKRKELADAQNVPPYVIFSDRTLAEMATYFPQSVQTIDGIYGMGATKLKKYGDTFLAIIQAYCAEKGIDEVAKTAVRLKPARQRPSGGKSRMEEVVELFNDGQTVPDIATHFSVKHSTVLSHLWKGIQAGHTLRDGDDLLTLTQLTPDDQERVMAAFNEHGTEALRPIFDALGETISYDELHLFRIQASLQP